MATAKPKVKRMMFGGAAKAAAGAAKGMGKLASQMGTQSQMQAAASKTAPRPGTAGPRAAPPAYAKPYASAQKAPTASQMPSQLASLAKAYSAQKSGNMGVGSQAANTYAKQLNQHTSQLRRPIGGAEAQKLGLSAPPKTGLGQAAPKQFMSDALRKGTMGAAMGAGRALGMGKKKGGAVKKATKK